ncbi:hypothetical protein K7887_22420 (plasmid) [Sutcliffiella horikoshii]|uniref:hypothetical protein n=1 Tax=Sutcliffiella horikoshii TaxID=79883 RepID=UPI001CBE7574|nr:hypothetical protein [Sutcliffiella horikoshii]UAL49875.1 hypothetical protein K7887_22420 [Sutcliffiella horikoshii]
MENWTYSLTGNDWCFDTYQTRQEAIDTALGYLVTDEEEHVIWIGQLRPSNEDSLEFNVINIERLVYFHTKQKALV